VRRWSELACDVREATVSGDHYSLWHGAGLPELGRVIRDALRHAHLTQPEGILP
jgi:hypothetical protein